MINILKIKEFQSYPRNMSNPSYILMHFYTHVRFHNSHSAEYQRCQLKFFFDNEVLFSFFKKI